MPNKRKFQAKLYAVIAPKLREQYGGMSPLVVGAKFVKATTKPPTGDVPANAVVVELNLTISEEMLQPVKPVVDIDLDDPFSPVIAEVQQWATGQT